MIPHNASQISEVSKSFLCSLSSNNTHILVPGRPCKADQAPISSADGAFLKHKATEIPFFPVTQHHWATM